MLKGLKERLGWFWLVGYWLLCAATCYGSLVWYGMVWFGWLLVGFGLVGYWLLCAAIGCGSLLWSVRRGLEEVME